MQPSAYRGIKDVTNEPAISRWVRWSNGPGEFADPCSLRAEPDGGAPPGRGADRPLQLPVRSPPGRAILATDRRHGPGPLLTGQPGTDRRGPALAGPEMGRNAPGPIRAEGHLPGGGRRLDRYERRLPLLLHAATA